jgi:putative acyl-CoA dehydrogenase
VQGAADALLAELGAAAGADAALDGAVASLRAQVTALETATSLEAQHGARRLAGQIAVTLAAALLVRHAPAAVADGFCASRFGPQAPAGPGAPFGTLPAGLDLTAIIARARAEPAGAR